MPPNSIEDNEQRERSAVETAKQPPTKSSRKTSARVSVAESGEGRVNVYQVAECAGVSPGTVSRVLNNRSRVHADTRSRVFEAARRLGFRPQVQVRTKQVAVISDNMWPSMHHGGYCQTVWAQIAFSLSRHDMALVVPDSPEELQQKHLDGIIVVGEYPRLHPLLAELKAHTPIVLTDDFSPAAAGHWVVCSDRVQAGQLAAEHLAKCGYKKLGFVGSWGSQEHSILSGYKEQISKAGLECHEELFILRDQEVNFYGAVNRVIRLGADGIFIPGSNYEGLEGFNVISNVMRMRIPKEIALIGGENYGVSEFLSPPMTTIEEPLSAIGDQAVATLTALMEGKKPPRKITLPVRLLAREST